MKFRHFFVCILLILITFAFAACRKEVKPDLTDEYGNSSVSDDSVPLSQIITKAYSLQELTDFFGEVSANETCTMEQSAGTPDLTFETVNQKYPAECLRKNGYSVYKVAEGGCFYVFWANELNSLSNQDADATERTAIPYFTAYISSLRSADDFDSIREGSSTAADVAEIDPAFELVLLMSSKTASYSLLNDGSILEICYYDGQGFTSGSDLVVKSKQLIEKELCPARLATILESDLP